MAVVAITGILRDGSQPEAAYPPSLASQRIDWPRAEGGTIKLSVVRSDGSDANLSGLTVVFAVRPKNSVQGVDALISRQATITDGAAGLGEFPITAGDTVAMAERRLYRFDVHLIDAQGVRWQLIPESDFYLGPIVSEPGDPVTVPPSATPLALGPSWLQVQADGLQETDGTTTEQLAHQEVVNLDLISSSLANIFADLSGYAAVTGGTGTIRVRHGGTADQPDGTLILTSDPVTGTTDAVVGKQATVTKPVGRVPVKITLQNNTAGQKTRIHSAMLIARGAA